MGLRGSATWKVKLRGKQRVNGAAGDASDVDGQTERSKWAGAHESMWAMNEFQWSEWDERHG
jgi:hypothetical protein